MTDMQAPTLPLWLTDASALQRIVVMLALLAALLLLRAWASGRAARRARAEGAALQARLQAETAAREGAMLRVNGAETRSEMQAARLAELAAERDGLSDALHKARESAADLARELASTRMAAAKDRDAAAHEVETLRQLRAEMGAQFKAMSAETLRVQAADTTRVQSEALGALLTPLKDQVHRFQTELQTRETAAGQERARLNQQIETLHQRSEAISQEAVALTRALKGDKQAQGAWGELILTQLLDESGLQQGTHYIVHETRHDADGRRFHPDVVVRMPGDRRIVVDSKVSLIAYEAASNAGSDADRQAALGQHVRALRAHVTGLSGKGYAGLDAASVEYVVMFVPIESAYYDAMRHDPELWRFAHGKGVIVAPPMNLIALLRTIEHLWSVERRESNAAEIATRAGALYGKVANFVSSMEEAGKALAKAGEAHERAMGQLSRGPGNVIRQVEQLKELGARTDKTIGLDHDRQDASHGAIAGDDGTEPDTGPQALPMT